jgi:DNA repair protein RadC
MLAKRYRLKLATWTVVREPGQPSPRRLNDPEAVAALARDLLNSNDDEKEHFWVLLLNTQNGLTCAHHVSMGSLSASIVHPREVFRAAVLAGAAHLILVHNHPSGDPTPSKEDVHLTRQLVEGARVLGLRVHDHVIVGNGSGQWVSLASRGLV